MVKQGVWGVAMTRTSKVATAEYVCAHTKELARLSKDAGLNNLAYMLEVAALEAETHIAAAKSKETA
jgi:hypothetical protein